MQRNKRGLTLIELLIVVLIIGILAAVAVPQYRMAVDKTKLIKLLPLARAIKNAQEVFWLEQGRYATTWEELGFDLPAFLTLNGNRAYSYYGGKNITITLNGQENFYIGTFKPNFLFSWTYDHFPSFAGRLSCYTYDEDAKNVLKKICTYNSNTSAFNKWEYKP